eukprot:CAMPEP_0175177642 /NCGR_PEP_ID=MMETSP0087-20121206/34506_1 /TAXON_ID=136419 /ORGANISM="Unknown Unknown, Strain D1" /LENGTH=452 /DNA_ID=CAMNT_0016469655 /DNA_START=140 /DNA_END=1495 /DNA_ORIENTATION=+
MATDLMYRAVHAPKIADVQPSSYANPASAVFFVATALICGMFLWYLVVGLVIDNFIKIRAEMDRSALQKPGERRWNALKPALLHLISLRERDADLAKLPPFQRKLQTIFTSRAYEIAASLVVQLSVLACVVDYYNAPAWVTTMKESVNYLFVCIFVVESVFKVLAFHKDVFKVPSVMFFELLVVIASLFCVVFRLAGFSSLNPAFLRIPLLFMSFKKIPALRHVYVLFEALVRSLKYSAFAALLTFAVMSIFAVVGVSLFGDVRVATLDTLSDADLAVWQDPFLWYRDNLYPQPLSESVSFRDFFHALLTVFQIVSLDDWAKVLESVSIAPPYCTSGANCGSFGLAAVYFVTILVVIRLVLLSLFLAVLIDQLNSTLAARIPPQVDADLKRFLLEWQRFDFNNEYLPVDQFLYLFHTGKVLQWELTSAPGVEAVSDPSTLRDWFFTLPHELQ